MQKHHSAALRELGALEHLFFLLDLAHPIHMLFAAEIDGTASPDEWREALDRAQARHPLLSARIEAGAGTRPRFSRVEGSSIPLRVVEAEPESQWQAEVYKEFTTPFDLGAAPLLRAVLVQGRKKTALILAAHHSVADGISMAFVIRDILTVLAGNALASLPLAPSVDGLLGMEEAETELKRVEPGSDTAAIPGADRRPAWSQMQVLRLGRDLTARIKDRARQEGTTVHGALMAAMAIAGRQRSYWQDMPIRFLSPVSIRQTLGVGEDCGVYVSGATTTFDQDMFGPGDDGSFWTLARHAGVSLAAGRTKEAIAPVVTALRSFARTAPDAAAAVKFASTSLAREAVLTNLGAFPFGANYGRFTLEAIWAAVMSSFGGEEQIVVVSTMNGVLCLTHSAHTPVPGLLEAMRDVLIANT